MEKKIEEAIDILMRKEGYVWCELGYSCRGWIKDLEHNKHVHNFNTNEDNLK